MVLVGGALEHALLDQPREPLVDVIGPWLHDRRRFTAEVVRPLQHKEETIYVTADSPAGDHVTRHFPRKQVKVIDSGIGPPGQG